MRLFGETTFQESLGSSFLKALIDFSVHATVIKIMAKGKAKPKVGEEAIHISVNLLTHPGETDMCLFRAAARVSRLNYSSLSAKGSKHITYPLVSCYLLFLIPFLDLVYNSLSLKYPLWFALGWEWSAEGRASPSCGRSSLWPQ